MFKVNVYIGKWDSNGRPINQEINEGALNNRSKESYIDVCSWGRMGQGTVREPKFQVV